eukprot:CAMPEP_0194102364 /NCGR_PEP_ID=MMETSP0150-20130528/2982_1 /TAXON_ID=122233 /ORGANISM="Chaetoceros debilis, Strain MM31A-1" /LENGTH=466 /DNA_ID=CAMNT_0038789299 /DNA_START=118 /DNA_END=1514 /DNA_ORIENTATION=-
MLLDAVSLGSSTSNSYDKENSNCGIKKKEQKRTKEPSILSSFLNRLHPCVCLCGKDDEYDHGRISVDGLDTKLDERIPRILADIDAYITAEQRNQEQENMYDFKSPTFLRKSIIMTERAKSALKELYELTDVKANCVPIVCTNKWDAIPCIANCLAVLHDQHENQSEIRRLACLSLKNLSIPFENKNIMVHGPYFISLLGMLLQVIRAKVSDTYLACIILMNLTYLTDGVEKIITYSPQQQALALNMREMDMCTPTTKSSYRPTPPLRPRSTSKKRATIDPRDWDTFPSAKRPLSPAKIRQPTPPRHCRSNSKMPFLGDGSSLLRSLEKLMCDQQPFLMSTATSMEGESIRWTVGCLRNLTRKDRHCTMVAKTEIPRLLLTFVEKSPHKITAWLKSSLEEMCLSVIGQLASSREGKNVLQSLQTVVILERIQRGAGTLRGPCTVNIRDKISFIVATIEHNRARTGG